MSAHIVYTADLEAEILDLSDRFPNEPEPDEADWDEWDRLQKLLSLKQDLDYCWKDNAALIRSSDFTEFAMELLYESGDLHKGGIADGLIDWDKAAEVIEQDYRLCTYDDEDYWVRA